VWAVQGGDGVGHEPGYVDHRQPKVVGSAKAGDNQSLGRDDHDRLTVNALSHEGIGRHSVLAAEPSAPTIQRGSSQTDT